MSGPDVKSKMINCVRKYPGMYESSHEMFRNRKYAMIAWKKISKCNIKFTAKAKEMWTSLRKSYIAYLKAPAGKKAPKYFEEMSFLRQYKPETSADGFDDDDEPVVLKTVPVLQPEPLKVQAVGAGAGRKKQPAKSKPNAEAPDDLKLFFDSMYAVAKKLPTSLQRHVKNQIFEVVSHAENTME